MITVKIDHSKFDKFLREYSVLMRKNSQEIALEFGKIVIKNLYELTPPSGKNNKGSNAKKALSSRIEKDILGDPAPTGEFAFYRNSQNPPGMFFAVIRPSKKSIIINPEAHLSTMSMRRGKGAYHRRWSGARPLAKLSDVRKLVRKKQKKVGRLAAGWNAGAGIFGIKPRAFIARHGTMEGIAKLAKTSSGSTIKMSNKVGYDSSHLKTIADYSVFYGKSGMMRRIAYMKNKFSRK